MARARKDRTHRASRVIAAPAHVIYETFLDPDAVAAWRPPTGMTAQIHQFEPVEGGAFRMSLIHESPDGSAPGKTADQVDMVEGVFVRFVPDRKVVELVEFLSEDPAFAGAMTITTTFTPAEGGTEVAIVCENVPEGIAEADHVAGITSTLDNLAAFVAHPAFRPKSAR